MPTAPTTRLFIAAIFTSLIISFVAIVLVTDPIPQDNSYHQLADRRSWLGLDNFLDIASNLPFVAIGLFGLLLCLKERFRSLMLSWSVFFAGLILVAIGSSYYHWHPNNATLMWDRLPMTISFMALLSAVLTENVCPRLEHIVLPSAVLTGLASVLYWRYGNDLRCYAFVQFGTLLSIPVIISLTKARHTHRHYLLYGLLCYALAKIFELNDKEIFQLSGRAISGHTLKHLTAAAATYCVYRMLKRRSAISRSQNRPDRPCQ